MTRWPTVLVLAVSCLYVGFLFWEPLPLSLPVGLRLFLTLLGILIYLPGILVYGWGFKTLGSMFAVSSGVASELYEAHHLVDHGPYAIVRHPMYLGVLMAAVGALLLFRTWAMVLFAPLSFGVVFRARREEKLLEEEFGEVWVEYRDRVPAWLPRFRRLSKDGSAP